MKLIHVDHVDHHNNFEFLYSIISARIKDVDYTLTSCDPTATKSLKEFFLNQIPFNLSIAKKFGAAPADDVSKVLMPTEFHYEFTLEPLDDFIDPLTIICQDVTY